MSTTVQSIDKLDADCSHSAFNIVRVYIISEAFQIWPIYGNSFNAIYFLRAHKLKAYIICNYC